MIDLDLVLTKMCKLCFSCNNNNTFVCCCVHSIFIISYIYSWRAYDTNEGKEVAWNVVKLNRIPPNERKRIKTEVKLLRDIEHKNVIKYYNSWVDREKEQIIFITEIMSHGSLKDYLQKNPIIRWNALKRWCRQILRGLEFLHEKKIIHRDIKCDNIFVNGSTGDVRIGDLGLSTRISEERALQNGILSPNEKLLPKTATTMTCLGTPEFMAPELYNEVYGCGVDVYAFGMTVLEMVTGIMPYHECTSTAQIYRKVLSGLLPPELELLEKLNPKCCSLVRVCLQKESSRPSATDLLSHEFFRPNEEEDFLEVRIKISKEEGLLDALAEDDGSEDEDDSDNGDGNTSMRASETPALSPKTYQVGTDDVHLSSTSESEEISSTIPNDSSSFSEIVAGGQITATATSSGDKGGSSTRVKSRLIQMLSPTPKASHNNDGIIDDATNNNDTKQSAGNCEIEKPLLEKPVEAVESTPRAEIFVLAVLVVNSTTASDGSSKSIRICLRVSALKESKEIDVEFEFDLEQDNTGSVALEMRDCEELKGVDIDASAIVEAIDPFVESARVVIKSKTNVHDEKGGTSLSELVIRNVLTKPENAQLPSIRLLLKSREEENRVKQSTLVTKVDNNPSKQIPSQTSEKEIDTSLVQLPLGRIPTTVHFTAVIEERKSYDDLDEDRVLPIDIDDAEDENDPEYLDIIAKAQEIILKIEKDYSQKLTNSQAQLDKAEEVYRKDSEKLTTRKGDLDNQLESLMEKFKVCK